MEAHMKEYENLEECVAAMQACDTLGIPHPEWMVRQYEAFQQKAAADAAPAPEPLSPGEVERYARNVLAHAPGFRDFAIAIMEFTDGADTSVDIQALYNSLRSTPLPPGTEMDSEEAVAHCDREDIEAWYDELRREKKLNDEEEKKKKKFRTDIDELQRLIKEYRDSKKFADMLEFVARNKHLAPYNALLVKIQKPSAKFVYNLATWINKYHRFPRLGAQALVTLIPFGPVQLLYDYGDTKQIPGMPPVRETELMEEWGLDVARGEMDFEIWGKLMSNLPVYGIYYDDNLNAPSDNAGYIMAFSGLEIDIPTKNDTMRKHCRFVLCVNRNLSRESKFCTICHELGHLFCRHLFYDEDKQRNLSHQEREFEAETVAWLVCKRHGIENPSEKYLATYARNGELPTCNLEIVMRAVAEIEKMLTKKISFRDSLWYKSEEKHRVTIMPIN